ncbi:MAG: formate dehydrogenase accessory sulfurtransferase FdhD [Candidatus Latescibacterota bacterium]|nr:MAG: formate dehydrogenase accessory sulfurtransferase FdhD [Candidatus Latescibacterota bacterium]
MNEPDKRPEALKSVRADRISTGDASKQSEEEDVLVVEETAVTIDIGGSETYTVLCTPTDLRAMAAGFLFTEGLLERVSDIKALRKCKDDPHMLRVQLAGDVPRDRDAGRNLLIVSSCGVCGSENLKERLDALPRVGDTLRVRAEVLRSVNGALRKRQKLFEACGGTHAAAVFDRDGTILSCVEDVGRHNALDKAVGKCLLAGIETAGRGVALSGRLSLEMVAKCARVGIEVVTAVSAPTSLAIDVGRSCNITLCAFVRETRATVFTHPSRVIVEDDSAA